MKENEIEEIKENTLYFLYRRGEPKHIQALYENGDLYINTIDSIRKCDQNEDRSDAYDGISTRNFLGDVKVKMCEVDKTVEVVPPISVQVVPGISVEVVPLYSSI